MMVPPTFSPMEVKEMAENMKSLVIIVMGFFMGTVLGLFIAVIIEKVKKKVCCSR